jgi:hypothetical protein
VWRSIPDLQLRSPTDSYEHAPALHDLLAALQSMQQALPDPQFELDVPG